MHDHLPGAGRVQVAERDEPVCSVLIPTYNRRATVTRCLEHLLAQDVGAAALQVIVVDDGSTDDTVAAIGSKEWPFHSFQLLTQPNSGPGKARNRGLGLATAPITLFINDDTLLQPAAVAAHLRAHAEHPRSMVLGTFDFVPGFASTPLGRILSETTHLFAYPLLLDGDVAVADLAATCNLSVATADAQHAGFDEAFTFAAEDVDFALRLQAQGHTLRFAAGAEALHDHHLTVEGIARMARLRGVGAAKLALKHGVNAKLLADVSAVMAAPESADRTLAEAVDVLDRLLDDAAPAPSPFPEPCYAALADIFRIGNLLGYLDEPALISRVRRPLALR